MTDLTAAPTGFSVPSALDALVKGLQTLRSRHAQRASYLSMLELDSHLLVDLGVTDRDVRDAMQHPAAVAMTLELRRQQNAARSLAHGF